MNIDEIVVLGYFPIATDSFRPAGLFFEVRFDVRRQF